MQETAIKTVFVIGAGSGYDFSMPLGSDLVQKIAEELQNVKADNGIQGLSLQLKAAVSTWHQADKLGKIDEVNAALQRLSRGIHFAKSIDTLINDAQNPILQALGKIVISNVINDAEYTVPFLFTPPSTNWAAMVGDGPQLKKKPKMKIDAFTSEPRADSKKDRDGSPLKLSFAQTWFTAFFRELRAGLSLDEFLSRLASTAIINFNYDRLTEHLLTVAHSQYDGLTFQEAESNLKFLSHIHPYGVLAPPATYEDNTPNGGVPLGNLTQTDIAAAPTFIRTYDEGTTDSDRTRINTIMSDAQNIVLLGYGFHRQNDQLLGLASTKATKVWATGIGLSDARRDLIASRIKAANSAKILIQNLNCRELIDEYGDDFFEYV